MRTQSRGLAPDLGQIGQPKPAPRLILWSFPQANAHVWKVDAWNLKKIQDVVVFC
jgi:hypothetical protein